EEVGDDAEFDQVVAGHLAQQLAQLLLALFGVAGKADRFAADAPRDDIVQPNERAAADEEDVARIDLDVLLLGVLAAALRRNVADSAFQHLQEGLLDALTAHVAGD